jgi:plastocyanin
MHRTFPKMIVLAMAIGLVATACSKSTPSASGTSSSSPAAVPSDTGAATPPTTASTIPVGNDDANDHGTKDVSGASTVTVEQHNSPEYYFSPTVLSGTASQKITVHLENKGTLPHTFTIDDQNISVELQPGDEKDIQVSLPASGSVEFYCQFHHSLGMAGELKVA